MRPAPSTPDPSRSLTAPVIDYEPPVQPLGTGASPTTSPPPAPSPCAAPATLRRRVPRRLRLVEPPPEQQLHPGATQFAGMALRRVLEVIDRRRTPAQLRPLMSPLLVDVVLAQAQSRHRAVATLQRVRLRTATDPTTAEVFATYTRGTRVRAVAARIEFRSGRWQLTALQLG